MKCILCVKRTSGLSLRSFFSLLFCSVYLLGSSSVTEAHWAPQIPQHNLRHALNLTWCGKSTRTCPGSIQAWTVVGCETGYKYNVDARNRKHLGIFQMGEDERRQYGHGNNVWAQSRAAHRYWLIKWWKPWTCAYRMGIIR